MAELLKTASDQAIEPMRHALSQRAYAQSQTCLSRPAIAGPLMVAPPNCCTILSLIGAGWK